MDDLEDKLNKKYSEGISVGRLSGDILVAEMRYRYEKEVKELKEKIEDLEHQLETFRINEK